MPDTAGPGTEMCVLGEMADGAIIPPTQGSVEAQGTKGMGRRPQWTFTRHLLSLSRQSFNR